ncbi:MAG TPA: Ldh family oxidoreductase, partial [Polyangia bacterium]
MIRPLPSGCPSIPHLALYSSAPSTCWESSPSPCSQKASAPFARKGIQIKGILGGFKWNFGPESAAAAARAMTDASARGVDTHGIRLAPHYLRGLGGGRIKPCPEVRAERLSASVVHVDADDGLGHLASYRAIEMGLEVARDTGLCAVAVGNSTHHGATGCYTLAAARQGCAALG